MGTYLIENAALLLRDVSLLGTISASPLLYLYNFRTDPNENTNNEEVFSFWSVLRLLLGNDNSVMVFSFWSVPRLLPENQEDNSFLEFLRF
jgi:hypothetical protein